MDFFFLCVPSTKWSVLLLGEKTHKGEEQQGHIPTPQAFETS